ncbi:MAG TPA: ABC transporter permease [Vicinamibacterales bacterium]|nr:ABC transporter permease [Vicinamibacterales bacterium]
MTVNDLKLRLRALLRPDRVEQELDEELAFHIERETRKLIDAGMTPREARARAQARFGSTALAADRCRDERGTALVDDTLRDVQYAWRTFAKAPLAAFTIVFTVAVGLGVVAAVFTVLNSLLFRVDQVPGVGEMYSVERTQAADGVPAPPSRAMFDAMRADTHVFTDAYAAVPEIDLHVDGRRMAVTLVTGNFFQVVRVNPVMGRPLMPGDDARSGGNPVMVLSHKGWDRHFNRDPSVLGRTVLVNGAPFEIIGITAAGFRGLEVGGPDLWAPLSQLGQFRPADRGREDSAAVEIVGRLRPDISKDTARAQLAAWDSNRTPAAAPRRSTNLDLLPRRGTIPQPLETVALFAPLFVAFGLILMIGCANVANLLLARGVARQREIGIRLSLGASRRRIVRQLMTESVLLALAAAAGGYLISRLALQGAVHWALQTMPVDIGDVNLGVPAADWRVAVFLVAGAVAATGFFALMPALHATAIDPVRTLRGELVKDARPGRARNALIGVQVFASALLLIGAAIFLRSAIASARFDPGLRTADTVMIDIASEPKRAAMAQAVANDATITAYAAVRPQLLAPLRVAFADAGAGKAPVVFKSVSGPYFDVLGIPIVRGRAFTSWERDQHPVAIVSESVARTLWPGGSGVGETFQLEPDSGVQRHAGFLTINPDAPANDALPQARMLTVVGVARDVPGFRITDVKEAGVFLPTALDVAKTSVVARVQGDPNLARQALLERLTRVDPNMGMIITMRTVARLETFFLEMAFWVSLILGGLALLLTVSGLFSVLSYLVEQRTREIGVRMALGASAHTITRLMLAQTARPVTAGLIAGAALAAALATAALATPAGALISKIVHVTDPVAYLASLGVIVAACLSAAWIPAARAAKLDPMRTLRQE